MTATQARDDLAEVVRRRIVAGESPDLPLRARIRRLAAEEAAFTPEALDRFADELTASVAGLGPLDALLADPEVSEVMVNGPDAVFVERNGRLEAVDVRFTDDDAVRALIERVVGPLGLRVDESSPLVDARLADGSRFNAALPPVSTSGPCCNIRRFVLRCQTFDELVEREFCSGEQAAGLASAVRDRRSVLVSGGTSTGKTTFLNVLSTAIGSDERLITIEDAAELSLEQDHVVGLEARAPNIDGTGGVSVRDLVRNALRMRPDRIIVGEVRGGEAADMLTAMTSGHDGSLGTIHANSPADAVARLEMMILTAEPSLPGSALRRLISSGLDLIVHLERDVAGRRRIREVTRVRSGADDRVMVERIDDWPGHAH